MNKKFSTLVAGLLLAGAWTTLDAAVVKVDNPTVGGSYLIGLTVTPNDGSAGQVGGLLKINAAGTGLDATADGAAAYQTVGGEWTLVDAKVTGQSYFYLVKDGKYICAADPTTDKSLKVSADDTDAANRIKFEIDGDKKIVVAEAIAGGQIVVGDELKIAGTAVTLESASSGVALEFGIYEADSEVTVGANTKQPLVSSFDKDTYYFIAAEDAKLLSFASPEAAAAGTVTAGAGTAAVGADADAYLWKVIETNISGVTAYSFENKAFPGKLAKVGQTASFTANAKYNKGVALYVGEDALTSDFEPTTGGSTDAIAFGFYEAIQTPYTVAELKKELVDGFNLTIAVKEDDKTEIKGAEAFAGKLVPVGPNFSASNPAADDNDATFKLMNGDKYVVLDTKDQWPGNIGDETKKRGAKFKLISKNELDNAATGRYLSDFVITHSAGKLNSNELIVSVKDYGRLFIAAGEYLTTSATKGDNETWAYAAKGASNLVDVKTLLGKYWNISFATPKADVTSANEYKLNGVLAVSYNATDNVADYVAASSVLLSAPETQWAVVSVDGDAFTLQNRETAVKVQDVKLRMTSTPNVYTVEAVGNTEVTGSNIANDFVKLTEVKDITKFDGFMKSEPNALRNQVFNIGQYHNETGNVTAYWAENHGNSHKLGVVTEGATDWKLYLDMKPGDLSDQVDTVLVITKLAALNKDGIIENEATPDTLAVLQYLVQNNSNLEYVLYKGNKLNYYACDEHANVEPSAQRFALKMKPNGTYNVVTLADQPAAASYAKTTTLGASKVFVANSEQWGSLDNMNIYSKDNNSLMVVEPLDKPEYRKVVAAWGDTVRIYREEYPTEELFEKRDAKSVVDGETLSFLNVDNSITGANPALFVDTAYVNRVDANGVANTCYQYLLAVNVDKKNSVYCPYNPEHNTEAWREAHGGPCADAKENPAVVKGRFLINLIDTANVYGATHLHSNPYVNGIEAGEKRAKLSFVEGIHTQDTLYITRKGGEVVKLAMDSPEFNVAKFAFRYVDNEAGTFKIQTRYKDYNPSATQKQIEDEATNEGYLKWINGTVVVEHNFVNGETFNMEENYAGNPTANENAPKVAGISVVATNGAVIVKGAEGKNVVITNVLGQQVVNTTVSSSEATIAAPAGVVFVAVEGEAAVKAIVK